MKSNLKLHPKLLDNLRQARHAVVFTGAGISAASGIPIFRDVQTGLWKQFAAEDIATEAGFLPDPEKVWGWYE